MHHISVVEVPFWPRHVLESFRAVLELEEQRSRQLCLLQGPKPVMPLRDVDAHEFVYDARRPRYLLDQAIEDQYSVRPFVDIAHLTNGRFPMTSQLLFAGGGSRTEAKHFSHSSRERKGKEDEDPRGGQHYVKKHVFPRSGESVHIVHHFLVSRKEK